MHFKQLFVFLLLSLALAGCLGISTTVQLPTDVAPTIAAPTEAPTRAPDPTAVVIAPTQASESTATLAPESTATTPLEPTVAPTATLAAEPADDQYGVTEDGYYWRGLASAPVVIEDYSDFL